MGDAKHTPGPWRWNANPTGGCRVTAERAGIADVLSRAGVPHPVQEHCDANARLISAAPDLLAACEASSAVVEHEGRCAICAVLPGGCEGGQQLRYRAAELRGLALAKARGDGHA